MNSPIRTCRIRERGTGRATQVRLAFASLFNRRLSGRQFSSLPRLSSVPGSPRLGKFVWADLVTDDVPAARTFYGQLLGWTFRDLGSYTIAANQDRPLCGLFQRARPQDKPQARPRWFGYLSVGNVERAARAVTEAGGRVLTAPAKFPKRGEQAVFSDPEGAMFGVIKSSSGDPIFLASRRLVWVQLLSRNAGSPRTSIAVGGYEVVENTANGRLSD
jgi:predicted enzyme related to lactoylglutathione lyase